LIKQKILDIGQITAGYSATVYLLKIRFNNLSILSADFTNYAAWSGVVLKIQQVASLFQKTYFEQE